MVARATAPFEASALVGFREAFSGEITLPEDAGYDAARVVWNGMIDRYPAIVARPTGVEDIITAVRFARDQGLLVAVRGGGHSVAGFSTCDGGIVIDLSRMRGVSVDPEGRTARANGGAHLGELDDAAQAFGLACPVGVVSHTGIAGLTLGGGIGRLQRKLGLTVDNLLAVELVTADGRTVRASEDDEPDLFWGIRGAGANFGIVTAFEFRLHPVGPLVTHGFVMHRIDRVRELGEVFRELEATAPDDVGCTFAIMRALPAEDYPAELAGRTVALIGVTHSGSTEDAERDLARLRSFGPPVVDTITVKPYLDLQHANDQAMGWGQRVYSKSGYLPSLPDEVLDSCVESLADPPGDCSFSIGAWGRAIARVPDDAMAYTGRDAAFWISAEAVWEDPTGDEAHVAWGREAIGALLPFTVAGGYVNDVVESGDDITRSIYGDAKYERLRALKRAWDPDNVFRLNHNIRP
jgi:FAD/FMN-containing dehydrogenase